MKKKEMIKQKNKLKTMKKPTYIIYAKYACVALVVLFLLYVSSMSSLLDKSFQELLSKNAVVIVGFMICTANLYIWYVLKHFINDIKEMQHIESIRLNLMVMAIGQAVMFNYISAILMFLALKKYFQWHTFSIKRVIAEIKDDGQLSVLVITTCILVLFIALVYGIYLSIA